MYLFADYSGGTKILGVWHHFEFNIPFAIRNMLASHPGKTLLITGIILAGSCSYALHVCERETGTFHNSLLGSAWIVLITMPAVGYGDMYAVTLCGRGISMVAALSGVLLVAVITATVYSMLTLMPYESRMVEVRSSRAHPLALSHTYTHTHTHTHTHDVCLSVCLSAGISYSRLQLNNRT
jgi:hypothetical protein